MAGRDMMFGILGFGSIGQRHAKNLNRLGHSVFSYDPTMDQPDRRAWLFKKSDAILVCTPSKRHAEDFIDAANAGKHVFVEKPFGYDCPPLLEGFLRGTRSRFPQQVIATGFNLRFHDCIRKAKERMATLGNPIQAKFHVLQKASKPAYLMDGIIRNWCSHELDLAMHLFNQTLEVVSCHATHDAEGRDTIDAVIKLTPLGFNEETSIYSKWHILIEADYTTEPQRRFFWIQGEKGTMYVDLEARTLTIDYIGHPLPYVYQAEDSWDQNYVSEMMAFVTSCQHSESQYGAVKPPLASGEEGVIGLYAVMKARELARVND